VGVLKLSNQGVSVSLNRPIRSSDSQTQMESKEVKYINSLYEKSDCILIMSRIKLMNFFIIYKFVQIINLGPYFL